MNIIVNYSVIADISYSERSFFGNWSDRTTIQMWDRTITMEGNFPPTRDDLCCLQKKIAESEKGIYTDGRNKKYNQITFRVSISGITPIVD